MGESRSRGLRGRPGGIFQKVDGLLQQALLGGGSPGAMERVDGLEDIELESTKKRRRDS